MKLVVLILSAFICAGLCVEDDPKCAWGPTYWCQGLKEAKSCQAIAHCKSTVWTNQVIQKDGSEVCQFCEAIIDDVKRFVEQEKTEEQISHFLSTACGVIPQQKIADECRTVVQLAMKEILELLAAELDPQLVCSLMKICSGFQDTVNHAPVEEKAPPKAGLAVKLSPLVGVNSEPICGDCKKFFTDIKQMITANKTEQEVEQMIDQSVCALLGSMEDECKSLVHAYLPEIMQFLQSYYDPAQICQSLGVCNADKSVGNVLLFTRLKSLPLYKDNMKLASPGSCLLCESVMHEIQSLDQNQDAQKKLISFVKAELCSKLDDLQKSCESACDLYAPELFELLATELDPTTRCKSLGFCPAKGIQADSVPMAVLQPAQKVMSQNSPVGGAEDNKASPVGGAKANGPSCIICEFVLKELRTIVKENATEAEIMQALEKVCDELPKTVSDSCHSFVEMYGPAVIQLILSEMDPEEICTAMGLCGQKISPTTSPKPELIKNGEACAVCETVIQYLEALVEQNVTEKELEQILEKICKILPKTMTEQCDDVIEEYGDLIIHYIIKMASPQEVCTVIHLCDGKKGAVVRGKKRDLVGGPEEIEVKQSVPVTGNNECTWGPSYWCLSRANAEKCNAVDHCERTEWKQ